MCDIHICVHFGCIYAQSIWIHTWYPRICILYVRHAHMCHVCIVYVTSHTNSICICDMYVFHVWHVCISYRSDISTAEFLRSWKLVGGKRFGIVPRKLVMLPAPTGLLNLQFQIYFWTNCFFPTNLPRENSGLSSPQNYRDLAHKRRARNLKAEKGRLCLCFCLFSYLRVLDLDC